MNQRLRLSMTAALGLLSIMSLSAQDYGTWEKPFTKNSIWYTPIGDKAEYVDARLDEQFHAIFDSQEAATDRTKTEKVLLYREDDSYPLTDIYESTWNNRCNAEKKLDLRIHLPAGFVYNSTPRTGDKEANGPWAFLWLDGSLRQSTILGRCKAGGPLQLPFWCVNKTQSLKGDGYTNSAGHGASGMSSLGGLIRIGELTGSEQIAHALKTTWPAHHYAYYGSDRKGHRWPARRADGYAGKDSYHGTNRALVMGALLAIRPEVDIQALALSPTGKKIARALQHYGIYLVEDSGNNDTWERWHIFSEYDVVTGNSVEKEAARKLDYTFQAGKGNDSSFKRDWNVILPLLHIVDNNTAETPGGGGTPLVDLQGPTGIRGNRIDLPAPADAGGSASRLFSLRGRRIGAHETTASHAVYVKMSSRGAGLVLHNTSREATKPARR